VLVVGAGNGTDLVLGQFSTTLAKAIAGTVTPAETAQAARYLDKLTLSPPFETELHILRDMATDKAATENATIVAAQYLAQIIVQSVNTYGLEVNEHVAHLYEELVSIDPTQSDNIFQMDLTLYKVVLLAEEIVDELFNGLVSGVTWLYPTAVSRYQQTALTIGCGTAAMCHPINVVVPLPGNRTCDYPFFPNWGGIDFVHARNAQYR
jgi:hypothetical protein